jgi:hypothetical protein
MAGDLDLRGDVPGVGGYAALKATAIPVTLRGAEHWVMNLNSLERAKSAAA